MTRTLLPAVLAVVFALAARADELSGQAANAPDDGGVSLVANPAPAATDDSVGELALFELEDVWNAKVVTASGREEGAATAAANVFVVTREELSARGYQSVAEALANVPGLFVTDDLVLPSIAVRGVTGGFGAGTRIVRVMINGAEVNFRPSLTAMIGPEFIPITIVERIEIAKGPLSALYGANAFLATVNVITRTPPEHALGGEVSLVHRRTNASSSFGAPGYGASATLTYETGGRSLLASVSTNAIDRSGLSVAKTFASQDPKLLNFAGIFDRTTTHDTADPTTAYLALDVPFGSGSRLKLQGGAQLLDSSVNLIPPSLFTGRSRVAQQNLWADARVAHTVSDTFSLEGRFTFTDSAHRAQAQLFLIDNRYTFYPQDAARTFDLSASARWAPKEWLTVSGGVQLMVEDQNVLFYKQQFNEDEGARRSGEIIDNISANDRRRVLLTDFGAHLGAAGSVPGLQKLTWSGDVRIDAPNLFAPQLSFRVSAAYAASDKFVLKAIGGSAFQTPSAQLLYAVPGFGTTYNIRGNLGTASNPLRPQKVYSAELVATGKLGDQIGADFAVFFQEVNDVIEFTQSSRNFTAINQGRLPLIGAELAVRGSFEHLSPYASVTTQVFSFDEAAQRRVGTTNAISLVGPSYPAVTAFVGLTARARALHLQGNVHARIIGSRGSAQSNTLLNNNRQYTLQPYATIDLSVATMDLHAFGEKDDTRLSITCRNLLNTIYAEPHSGGFDLPGFGRTVLFELRESF